MPISDDDLNYLRNINTIPGPNAGKSIDPTKPGPSDKTDKWDREHVKRRAIVQDEKGRFEAIDKAAFAQSDAELAADAKLIEAAEWLSTAASRFEEAADALRSEYKTYARQLDRLAGDTRERARLLRIFSCSADRGVHGELIPDCPTEGVAARQGNGG
jgi:ATPase subunit of ABC transporter with duplicated ATPase domains